MKINNYKQLTAGICRSTGLFILAGIVLVLADGAIVSGQSANEDVSCFHCHSRQVNDFQKSIHFNKNISCTDCHGGDININGSTISIDVMDTNFSGIPTKNNINEFCLKCHVEATRLYKESIHWEKLVNGRKEAASCIDCHGSHSILSSKNPESATYTDNVPQMCADCHENQTKMRAWYYGIRTDRFDTYKNSYHYKALVSGGVGVATCPDCHENHNTKAQMDPTSAINRANLPATCGKTGCHPGQNAVIYGGKVHEDRSVYIFAIDAKKLVTYFYMIMIVFELTFTLGLISLAVSSKFEIRRRNR